MPKDRKKLDFHELMRQPGFEWIRLYFEKNYPNKNFIVEPVVINSKDKKDGVYYLLSDAGSYSYLRFDGKMNFGRNAWVLGNSTVFTNSSYRLQTIKITVI